MGKKQTPVTNLNPSGMSENSSKSMKPPSSDEPTESKENLGKGVKTNANNSSGNPKSPKSVINHANPSLKNPLVMKETITLFRKRPIGQLTRL